MALVRGWAAATGRLVPMYCEQELLGSQVGINLTECDSSLWSAAALSRSSAVDVFSSITGDLEAETLRHILSQKEGWLLQLDRGMAVDIAFLRSMLGSPG